VCVRRGGYGSMPGGEAVSVQGVIAQVGPGDARVLGRPEPDLRDDSQAAASGEIGGRVGWRAR